MINDVQFEKCSIERVTFFIQALISTLIFLILSEIYVLLLVHQTLKVWCHFFPFVFYLLPTKRTQIVMIDVKLVVCWTELMLLGFISLLMTVFQRAISKFCVPKSLVTNMLPCKLNQEKKDSSGATTTSHFQTFFASSFPGPVRRFMSEHSAAQESYCSHKVISSTYLQLWTWFITGSTSCTWWKQGWKFCNVLLQFFLETLPVWLAMKDFVLALFIWVISCGSSIV